MLMKMDALNAEQQEAVMHATGPLLVLAGAGSGKTRIVTHRIVNLIESGVAPVRILAVTFTNKAAEEMRSRVAKMTKQSVLVSTFHSLGSRLLRQMIDTIGYRLDFAIYDEEDSLKVLKTVAEELKLDTKKAFLKKLKNLISNAKNAVLGPEQVEDSYREIPCGLEAVYERYQQRLQAYNAVDFDDLLYLPVRIFREHPEVLARYQERWDFLLIDEYQDTNEAQYAMIRLLAEKHGNVFVVGDPDQSIYSWRGANINNILNFEEDFEGARVVRLEQNYRSTQNILDAANALIQHNIGRYEKSLWSDLGEGEKIRVFRGESEYEEANYIVQRLLHHHEVGGVSLKDMVIFYRTNFQSRQFEDWLLAKRIPYVIVGGISFYQRKEIKDLLAFLRLVHSGADFVSFSRVVNIPKRGLGNTTLEKLRLAAETEGMPVFDLCCKIVDDALFAKQLKITAKQKKGLEDFVHVIRHLRDYRHEALLSDLVSEAILKSGYLAYVKATDEDSFDDRKENLQELVSKAVQWDEDDSEDKLASFLEELTLKSTLDEASEQEDHLKLMTLHNGKGLEFDIVFMVGLEEDLLPHANSRGDHDALEEERRLCYVGMTRARKLLYMTSAEMRTIWGTYRRMPMSGFMAEIPAKYKELVGGYMMPDYAEDEDVEFAEPVESGARFDEGDTVFHKDYGVGTVLRAYQGAMGLTYEVYFQKDDATRTLVATLCQLVAID